MIGKRSESIRLGHQHAVQAMQHVQHCSMYSTEALYNYCFLSALRRFLIGWLSYTLATALQRFSPGLRKCFT